MPSGSESDFRVLFPTALNLCKHCLRQFREDVRRQGVSNADTQTEALGGSWSGDLCAGGTRTRGATGRTRGTNSTEPWRLPPHEVNPLHPQRTAEAVRFIPESLTEMHPGEQMLMVGQTDAEGSEAARERGEGGKYHVHVVINSVIAKDMVVEGERYRAGQRLRGDLTDIDELRRRMDERLNERHAEYGLPAQTLAPVGSEQYERGKSDPATYWARLKGKLTDKEKVREGVDLAIEHMSVTYAGSLAGLDRNDRMRTFSETLEAVTDGDVTTSLRET